VGKRHLEAALAEIIRGGDLKGHRTINADSVRADAIRQLDEYIESLLLRFRPFQEAPGVLSSFPSHAGEVFSPRAHLNYLLRLIDEAWRGRRTARLRNLFDELYEYSENNDLGIEERSAQIDAWLDIFHISDSKIIFEVENPAVQVLQLLSGVNEAFIRLIAREPTRLFSMSPRRFEELIAELFHRNGFEVHLTAQTRDNGRDIVAFSNRMNVPMKYIIECKRYAPDNAIGIDVVQRLFGVQISEKANRAILATTSRFTGPAKRFIDQNIWHLDGKAYEDIVGWLSPFKGMNP